MTPKFLSLTAAVDCRGDLFALNQLSAIGFVAERLYFVHRNPQGGINNAFALRSTTELFVPLDGDFACTVNDGLELTSVVCRRGQAILIPPMHWTTRTSECKSASYLAVASSQYDPSDYIRDYEIFLAEIRRSTI